MKQLKGVGLALDDCSIMGNRARDFIKNIAALF